MGVGCPLQQEQFTRGHTPEENGLSFSWKSSCARSPSGRNGTSCASVQSTGRGWPTWSCSGNHSYCEFTYAAAIPYPEDAISQHPSLYSGSCNLSVLTEHSETARRKGSYEGQHRATVKDFLNRTPLTLELISTSARWKVMKIKSVRTTKETANWMKREHKVRESLHWLYI